MIILQITNIIRRFQRLPTMAFYGEQRATADQIITKMTCDGGQPFTILLAQMQSGKTGTYLCCAFEMIRLDLVDHVFIICGSSDTSLKEQAKRDMELAFKTFKRSVRDVDQRDLLDDATVEVFFSQDMAKSPEIGEKTLIIHDECHMAQSKNNIPFKMFYQKNNLDGALMGDFSVLKAKNNYILGVSATPFSEIISNKKVLINDWSAEESALLAGVDLDPKNFFFMNPGTGYIGVQDLIDANAIKFEAENIKTDDCEHISSILRKKLHYENRFVVIRTHCAGKDKDMMETIASSCGYTYKAVFGGDGGSLEFMNTEPLKKTLVHICGRFRMGQVVPKRFIAMVYEQSANPNADTILQGLVGRMCGYSSGGSHLGVDIYVSPKAEELVKKYGEAWSSSGKNQMDTLSEVTKAMNLGGVKRTNGGQIVEDENGGKWIKTVPIKFLIGDLDEEGVKFTKITPQHLTSLIRNKPELIEGNPDKEDIIELINCCADVALGKPYIHHKNAAAESYKETRESDFKLMEEGFSGNIRRNLHHYTKKDIKKMNNPDLARFSPISLLGSNIATPGNEEGICYLMGFVRYDPARHPEETPELAFVDPKCNYVPGRVTMEDDTVIGEFNGGQIITFSIDTASNPNSLEQELRQAILRTDENHPSYIPSCTRSIHSLFDKETKLYEGIRLDKSIYTEEGIETIKDSLNEELSVNIKLKKSRGRQPKDQIKYASISW